MRLEDIARTLLDPASTQQQLQRALDQFIQTCGKAGGILPDPAFSAWAGDSFLAEGVAIAPQAAANCARDYQRAIMFTRGVHAAIAQASLHFPDEPLRILYAGCGPYGTLLLPLLPLYRPEQFSVCLLDIHQRSLDSVLKLLEHFGLAAYNIETVQGDACTYQHPRPLHLVISETMQKSLEQEPQFAVTAHLARQLIDGGTFIPQKIDVRLCLTPKNLLTEQPSTGASSGLDTKRDRARHYQIGTALTLTRESAVALSRSARFREERQKWELPPLVMEIPALDNLECCDAALFTRIQVYDQCWLEDYDAEITLPQRCTDMAPLKAGDYWEISYQLGSYPRFHFGRITRPENPGSP